MKTRDKPMPVASLPDNWSAFSGHEVLPWEMSRAEAAATLRRARSLRARGKATVRVEAVGRCRLSTFECLIPDNRCRRTAGTAGRLRLSLATTRFTYAGGLIASVAAQFPRCIQPGSAPPA